MDKKYFKLTELGILILYIASFFIPIFNFHKSLINNPCSNFQGICVQVVQKFSFQEKIAILSYYPLSIIIILFLIAIIFFNKSKIKFLLLKIIILSFSTLFIFALINKSYIFSIMCLFFIISTLFCFYQEKNSKNYNYLKLNSELLRN